MQYHVQHVLLDNIIWTAIATIVRKTFINQIQVKQTVSLAGLVVFLVLVQQHVKIVCQDEQAHHAPIAMLDNIETVLLYPKPVSIVQLVKHQLVGVQFAKRVKWQSMVSGRETVMFAKYVQTVTTPIPEEV